MQATTVVGYQNLGTDGCESPSIGATFVPLSGESVYRLGDMKMNGAEPEGDVLQILDPDSTELLETYGYCSAEYAAKTEARRGKPAGTYDYWIGWWEVTDGFDPDDDDLRRDDVEINVGQGFLGLMSNEISFECNGEVPQKEMEVVTDGCESPFIANFLPKAIKLGWIVTGGGAEPEGDVLQLLDPDSTDLLETYGYCSAEYAAKTEARRGKPAGTYDYWIGWWEVTDGFDPDDDDLRRDDVDVPAGQAFLGLMSDDIAYEFPSALYNGEDAE